MQVTGSPSSKIEFCSLYQKHDSVLYVRDVPDQGFQNPAGTGYSGRN